MAAPRALVIEASLAHAAEAQIRLEDGGFAVEMAASFGDGMQLACALLDPARPAVPTVILLDLNLPHPRCPEPDGTALAARLSRAMQVGALRRAHLVATTSDDALPAARCADIVGSGCDLLLITPLRSAHVRRLRALADQPPRLAPAAPGANAVAQRAPFPGSPQIVQRPEGDHAPPASSCVVWDKQHVKTLLMHPTRLLREEPWAGWIRRRGGIDAIYQVIAAPRLPPKLHELRATILECIPTWETGAERLKIARQTYYRHLDRLAIELATILNDLPAIERLQDHQWM